MWQAKGTCGETRRALTKFFSEGVNQIFLCPRNSSEGDAFEISTNHSYFCLQCLAGNHLLLKLLTRWANSNNAPVQPIALPASRVRAHTHIHSPVPCQCLLCSNETSGLSEMA